MLTRDTLIIVVVFSAVAALVLLYLLVRFLTRRVGHKSTSNPLPPVQALAHHKEQQLNAAWYPSVSRASLITKSQNASALTLPSPSFHNGPSATRPASSSSLSSNGESPVQSNPPSAFPRTSLSSNIPQPPPTRKPRPLSVSSSHSTVYSKGSPQPPPHHLVRGTPHGPHSQVQITMPIPLSVNGVAAAEQRRLSRRKSLVDMWVPGNIHDEVPPRRAYSTVLTPVQGIAE